jgi:hypothetical protein
MRSASGALAVLTIGALVVAVGGCGGSGAHRKIVAGSATIKYLGGSHSVVSARVPSGPAFSIAAQRYLFWGRHHLELSVHFAQPARVQAEGSSWRQGAEPLEWGTQSGCAGHPFVIVYGLLKAPADSVFIRVSGKLVELRKASLPASLHTGGLLVYGTSSRSVSGLLTETNTGRMTVHEQPGITVQPISGACHRRGGTGLAIHEFPVIRHVLAKVTECLRHDGFGVTVAGVFARGPLLDTHAINTKSARFKASRESCSRQAIKAVRTAGGGSRASG